MKKELVAQMDNFLDFLKSKKKDIAAISGPASKVLVGHIATGLTSVGWTADKAHSLALEVKNFSESEEFLAPVSREIGKPRVGETEDEFVNRAKKSIKEALVKRFENK